MTPQPQDYRARVRRKFQPIVIERTVKKPGDVEMINSRNFREVGRG